jgi:hypothetical protein
MTYASPAWEFEANIHLMKLQRLQNKVLRTIDNYPGSTPVRDLHLAFQITFLYDYIKKLCRQQGDVIQNHDNEMFAPLDKANPVTENIGILNLTAVKNTTVQLTRLPL